MGRSSPNPPPLFWQLNHANSAYFGAISANFPQFQHSAPAFLQILDPAPLKASTDWGVENSKYACLLQLLSGSSVAVKLGWKLCSTRYSRPHMRRTHHSDTLQFHNSRRTSWSYRHTCHFCSIDRNLSWHSPPHFSQHSQLFSKQSRSLHSESFDVLLPQMRENSWSIPTILFKSAIFSSIWWIFSLHVLAITGRVSGEQRERPRRSWASLRENPSPWTFLTNLIIRTSDSEYFRKPDVRSGLFRRPFLW